MSDPWARLPAQTAKVKAGDPDLIGALKATSAEIGAGLVHTLHSIPIWARDDPQHGAVPVTSSVDDLGPFRRKLQQQEHSVTAELVGGAFDPADMTIVQDALDIGAMDLDNYPENARWFAAHPEHASSAEDRWWGLMLATAAKRGDDNARRFPRLRAEYLDRADQIFERARDLVFLYEADYRMWSVTPNPALAGVGARIAYAVRTYPDRHRFDNWFYSMEPEEGVRRMLRDEHPELLVALDEVARMPGTTTWWPLPRPRPSHDDDDDPWYETAIEVGIAIIPFIGEAVMAYEAVLGHDLFGHELSAAARTIRVVGVALPILGRLAGETRAAITWEGAAVREEDRFIAEAPSARTASDTTEKVRARTAADIAAEDTEPELAAPERTPATAPTSDTAPPSGGKPLQPEAGGGRPPTRAQRVSELAEDPGRGIDKVTIREAKDAVTLEELGPGQGVRGPLRRADPARYPREEGADFVDANGQLWDHKVAFPKTGEQGQSVIGSLNELLTDIEGEFGRGEDIMLNHALLNDAERAYLLREIGKRGLPLDRFRFIPPL